MNEEGAPDRIWLCGFGTNHGDISWSSHPNPTGDLEIDGKQVEYVRADLANLASERVTILAELKRRHPGQNWNVNPPCPDCGSMEHFEC